MRECSGSEPCPSNGPSSGCPSNGLPGRGGGAPRRPGPRAPRRPGPTRRAHIPRERGRSAARLAASRRDRGHACGGCARTLASRSASWLRRLACRARTSLASWPVPSGPRSRCTVGWPRCAARISACACTRTLARRSMTATRRPSSSACCESAIPGGTRSRRPPCDGRVAAGSTSRSMNRASARSSPPRSRAPGDAVAAPTGTVPWPGAALVWAVVENGVARLAAAG